MTAWRIILASGGTGGHIYPAIAVAQALKGLTPNMDILFMGGLYGPEQDIAQRAGLEFHGLEVRGVAGRGLRGTQALLSMGAACVQARQFIRCWKPDAVMGFGGYASLPPMLAAWSLGRPTALHEQNAFPGLANRLLARTARLICLSWPDQARSFPPGKSVLTGNPIRQGIAADAQDLAAKYGSQAVPRRPRLLVMGGSQGAVAINSLVISLLASLRDAGVAVIHQTGPRDVQRVREAYRSHGYTPEEVDDMVHEYLHDMPQAYAWADLALCRAGASTLAELAAAGLPSVLVPFPHAAHDHQNANAGVLEQADGAVRLREDEMDSCDPAGLIIGLLRDRERLRAMSQGVLALARPDAAHRAARLLLDVAINKTGIPGNK